MRFTIRCLLWLLVAAPAVFLFWAIQASAITVPFWDNCELITVISDYLDGRLALKDLWRPHNQHRPLTLRLLQLTNAIATHWDVRSEFTIHIAVIFAGFALQLQALWRLTGRKLDTVFLAWAAMLSAFAFSPAGHNNHWWSFMMALNLAHVFILYALLRISFSPRSWAANLQAAVGCWLATYSLANGLVAFVCCAGISQLCSERPWRPTRWSAFWAVNLLLVAAVYLPGLPPGGGARPGVVDIVWFSIVYLGSPLRGLLHYPYRECFHIPIGTLPAGIIGLLLLGFAGGLLWSQREPLRRRSPGAVVAVSFMVFALLSAAMTSWGRASFDEYGLSTANSSRFTLFGGYFVVGLLLFVASLGPDAVSHPFLTRWISRPVWTRLTPAMCVLFLILSAVSYSRSVRVYASARTFNSMVIEAYFAPPSDTTLERRIFPDSNFVARLKKDLQRHHLGPFRDLAQPTAPLDPLVLTAAAANVVPRPVNRSLKVRFDCPADIVTGIDVFLMTYGQRNSGYCQLDVLDAAGRRLAWSRLDASSLRDVAYQTFEFNDLADLQGQSLQLVLTYHTDPRVPGMVAVHVPDETAENFNFRVRGKNGPVAEFARRKDATSE